MYRQAFQKTQNYEKLSGKYFKKRKILENV